VAQWYRQALVQALLSKNIDWNSDTIVTTLHTSSYTPVLDSHTFVSDLTNELAASGGYTTGGVTLTSATGAITAANSWATQRANSTAYVVGNIVRPATGNGYLYSCTVAGTSGGSIPTYPTVVGQTVADGGVTWTCVAKSIIVLTAANASWSTASFTGVRYAVLSDRTPGSAATQPLLGLVDFVTDQAGSGGAFSVVWDPQGILQLLVP
jgi:hypothetical protein